MNKLQQYLATRCAACLTYFLIFCFVAQPAWAQFETQGLQGQQTLQQQGVSDINFNDLNISDLSGQEHHLKSKFLYSPNVSRLIQPNIQKIKVHVLGDVQNPGVYTAQVSDRVTDLLSFSAPKRKNLRIVQIRNKGKTKFYDLYRYYFFGNLSQNPFLQENDVIFVPHHKGAIRIEGPVARPGVYELNREKTMWDVVKLAGKTTDAMSKKSPVKVIRFDQSGKRKIVDVENGVPHFKKFKIKNGDIIVVPDIVNSGKEFDYSVETIPGENLVYPTSVPDIFVMGSVSKPGPYPYKSHLTIKEYVAFAAPHTVANLNRVKIVRHGKKIRARFSDKINAGDIIIVKEKIRLGTFIGYFTTFSTILLTALLLEDRFRDR